MSLNDGRRRKNRGEEWRRQKCLSKDIVATSAKNAGTASLASEVGFGRDVRRADGGTALVHVTDL
jgi:hypothetical protein